jgi:hypothetical protein
MKTLKRILTLIFWFSLLLYIFLLVWRYPLPSQNEIRPQLFSSNPLQTPIKKSPYIWKAKNQSYRITPLFDYDITGLVVADYDSQNWLDFSHKNDPAQTKDLCLIWGDNIQNGVYRNLKYHHGEFTCYVDWDETAAKIFNLNQLSNNHLIPSSPQLTALIKSSGLGDQVHIKGQLVNYEILDSQGQVISTRDTSTIREDRGCEVIMVSDFQILQKPEFPYLHIKAFLPTLIVIAGLANLILYFFF